MRFDELTLHETDGELRVRFHPALTMLCGLGADERQALSEGILCGVGGGSQTTRLHLTAADGRHLTVMCQDGRLNARYEDGTEAPPPLGALGNDPVATRSLMLLGSDELGVLTKAARDNEPAELREARDMLDTISAELAAALSRQQAAQALQSDVERIERELRSAHDGVARREYALVLAQLERVRAEASAVDADSASVESDRHLLASAEPARSLVRAWIETLASVETLRGELGGQARLEDVERDELAVIPAEPPPNLDQLIDELRHAIHAHAVLDQRLQSLSVAKLPAPSDPSVADLGLLDQAPLWASLDRASAATTAMRWLQVSLGGLEVEEMGAAPELIAQIEEAHDRVEAAERAVAAARLPGFGAAGLGAAVLAIGALGIPLLIPVGLVVAAVAAVIAFIRPASQHRQATRSEAEALGRADATSYLGFHIRRVEASVDPELRESVEATVAEHRHALAAWREVGGAVELDRAIALRAEIEAYSHALRSLGDTADEIEQLRLELVEQAEPALRMARAAVVALIGPYGMHEAALDDPDTVAGALAARCALRGLARTQTLLDEAEVDWEKTTARLEDLLLELGFDDGPIEARAGALDWAIGRAAEREDARKLARPRAEVGADLKDLQDAATRLRRPEWATVTAADAAAPDITELEARREVLLAQLAAARPEVDAGRVADRHAAVERRVAALEARYSGHDVTGDPAAIAGIRQHLLTHLLTAVTAGPSGDPVPVVLDEVFTRVPADRTWDLLDQLLNVAEGHQLIYLSDDAFVAAWARKRASEGSVTLLELAPEPAG